jgi:hypothetical protein
MSTMDGTYAYAQGFHTPKKVHLASSVGGLVSAISEWDSQEVVAHAEGLPRAVRGALRGVPYELRLCEHGFQADGFSKFAGAGWIPAETAVLPDEVKGKAVELPPTLEIRSVFVPERLGSKERDPSKDAATARRDALWQRWMSSGKKYAEFVTWLDVPARSWTIYKVFLNDVLPGGKNYGAKAVAEHLASDPRTFFGQGDLQQADLPEFARAVTDLETIKICDVVNWNTYVLMAIVASPTRNIDMFGEHMAPLLSQELAASRTSAAELQSASPLEVFVRTALGKMTKKIIQIWNARFGLSLYIKSVSVSFVRGAQERIIGELRDMMILRVGIAQEGGQCGDTTAVSVSEAMAVDTVEVGHNVDKLDEMAPIVPAHPNGHRVTL